MVREVLADWMDFLSPAPAAVLFSVSAEDEPPVVYRDLRAEGRIDRLLFIPSRGRSPYQIDPEAHRLVIAAAETDWVVLVKLDVLPFRKGSDNWLLEAVRVADQHGYFGLTGSFRSADLVPGPSGFCRTQRFSNGFSVFRRDAWLGVIDEVSDRTARTGLRNDRYIQESAIENHLKATNTFNLFRPETPDWTIFHINQWGEDLRRIREDYRNRRRIGPFMNVGTPLNPKRPRPGWERYYGYPQPPLLRRAYSRIGSWRRRLLG